MFTSSQASSPRCYDYDDVTLSAPEGNTTRCITDTILISCLPVIDLIQTKQLVIQYCSLQVLAHTVRKWKVFVFAYAFIQYHTYCFCSTL